ncbi:MAG TPA: hypothetical protein VF867_19280 [Arthrobacter sp.]
MNRRKKELNKQTTWTQRDTVVLAVIVVVSSVAGYFTSIPTGITVFVTFAQFLLPKAPTLDRWK